VTAAERTMTSARVRTATVQEPPTLPTKVLAQVVTTTLTLATQELVSTQLPVAGQLPRELTARLKLLAPPVNCAQQVLLTAQSTFQLAITLLLLAWVT
jgi:hypothetical protein